MDWTRVHITVAYSENDVPLYAHTLVWMIRLSSVAENWCERISPSVCCIMGWWDDVNTSCCIYLARSWLVVQHSVNYRLTLV